MSLESGPFMTMCTLGLTGLAAFPWQTLVGALLPFLIGFTLGNLDKNLRDFFSQGVNVMVPFFAFALGNGLNFTVIAHTGLLGILLGLTVMVVTGSMLILADILLAKGNGTAGVAAGSTAGAAVTVPAVIASLAPQYVARALGDRPDRHLGGGHRVAHAVCDGVVGGAFGDLFGILPARAAAVAAAEPTEGAV